MTTKRRPPMFGADAEADAVLDDLPRRTPQEYPKTEPNAWVYIDAAGNLCILPVNGGWLSLNEKNLAYLRGDGAPFCD